MKESVDLTEERLFSTSFHTEEMEVRHKFELPFYKHKNVPWERTDKGELAKTINLLNKIKRSIYPSFVLNNNFFEVNSDDDLIYNDENLNDISDMISVTIQRSRMNVIDEFSSSTNSHTFILSNRNISISNNLNGSNSFISNKYNTISVEDNSYTIYPNYSKKYQGLRTYEEYSLEDALDICLLIPDNSQIFPTGHKKDIIKTRRPYQSYDDERDLRSRLRTTESKITCKICGKSVLRKEYEKKFLWKTNLCEFCFNKHIQNPKKISSSSEYFMNRFIRDKSDEFMMRKNNKYSEIPTRVSQCYESDVNKRNKERNCLLYYESFYDEPEVHKYQKNNYNKFYLMWNNFPVIGSKNVNKLSHFDQAVYFKGRNVERRAEPWQPSGRQKQWYDSLFDSMNWKDLFKKKTNLLSLQ